jgi:hypothetical protein
MDYAEFSDPSFDPKSWINALVAACPTGEPLDTHLSSHLSRLQQPQRDAARVLEETAAVLVARVPRMQMEADRMRREALSLKTVLERAAKASSSSTTTTTHTTAHHPNSTAEVSAANDAMQTIATYDRVYSRLERCHKVLSQAAAVLAGLDDLDFAFHNNDYAALSNQLAAMQGAVAVLHEFPQFTAATNKIKELQDRLERIVLPTVMEFLLARQADGVQQLLEILHRAGSIERVFQEYAAQQSSRVQALWVAAVGQTGQPQAQLETAPCLRQFTENVVHFFREEAVWLKQVFSTVGSTPLHVVLSTAFTALQPPIPDVLNRSLVKPLSSSSDVARQIQLRYADVTESVGIVKGLAEELTQIVTDTDPEMRPTMDYVIGCSLLTPVHLFASSFSKRDETMIVKALASSTTSLAFDTRSFFDTCSRSFAALLSMSDGLLCYNGVTHVDHLCVLFLQAVRKRGSFALAVSSDLTAGIADLQACGQWKTSLEDFAMACRTKSEEVLQKLTQQPSRLVSFYSSSQSAAFQYVLTRLDWILGSPSKTSSDDPTAVAPSPSSPPTSPLFAQAAHQFPNAVEEWKSLNEFFRRRLLDLMVSPLRSQFQRFSLSNRWTAVPQESAYDLPTFAPQPSDEIAAIGESLLSLPEKLESMGREGIPFLDEVCARAIELFLKSLQDVPAFSALGWQQAEQDARYMQNISRYLSDHDNSKQLVFDQLVSLMTCPLSELNAAIDRAENVPSSVAQSVKLKRVTPAPSPAPVKSGQ